MKVARRILIVEDDALIRSLVSALLESKGFEVRTANSAAHARSIADEFDPDLALLDIELGEGPSGIDLSVALRHSHPALALVFLTHIPEPRVVGVDNRSIPKNAGYLYKGRISDPGVLEEAIEAALRDKVNGSQRHDKTSTHIFSEVSRSQLEVIKMIALGYTNAQIAAERGTTVRAVENLLNRAFEASGIEVAEGEHMRVKVAREYIKAAGLPLG